MTCGLKRGVNPALHLLHPVRTQHLHELANVSTPGRYLAALPGGLEVGAGLGSFNSGVPTSGVGLQLLVIIKQWLNAS